ncbi:hypothetical protein PR048_026148 [Dryococelus australis]|uniref:Uncharacterized protein n=1 Tax=Dryococelus australis TaxID=614101 RepID=A0ABQ9GKK9_9NEOP|nr:hypothetical protein PR048_026148 [Dryococelus australis]
MDWRSQMSLPSKKSRLQKSSDTTMLIAFFDNYDIIHTELVPADQTVMKITFYEQVLKRLLKASAVFDQSCT